MNGFAFCSRFCAIARRLLSFPKALAVSVRDQWKTETHSIKWRLTGAFLLLTLVTASVFAGIAWITFDVTITRLVQRYMEPTMRQLVAADEEDDSEEELQELASALKVHFFTGADVPEALRSRQKKKYRIVRVDDDRYAVTYRSKQGKPYAIIGKIRDVHALEELLSHVLVGCFLGSLAIAGLLGLYLSRRLVRPLTELSRHVKAGQLESGKWPMLAQRKDEIGFLARTLAAREQELCAFVAREQMFTGDVSHELRTPLTVMLGGLEILESRFELTSTPLMSEAIPPVLERMHRTLTDMINIVNTLLLLARKPEQLECSRVDLSDMAHKEMEKIRPRLEGRPIALISDIPEGIYEQGNSELIKMVFKNLLENACLYTEAGSIAVSLTSNRFIVADTAPSIPPDVRIRMFERGVRGKGTAAGSGLGLSLTQRACEHMDWTVTHENPSEGGNRFIVSFSRTVPL